MGKVIGLIGEIASGKTIVSKFLIEEKDAGYHRFSDVLRDILERLHLENNRENLQALGNCLRQPFGDNVLADVLKNDVLADESDIVLVDGIRYLKELEMVKSIGGVILYISAPAETRYERSIKRGTRGEGGQSFEEFMENENKATERGIAQIVQKTDHKIENTGTMEELLSSTESFLESLE